MCTQLLRFLMFAALAATSLSAAQASAAVLRGTVTCNGQPAYHALVQGFADADSTAPLGEAFTNGSGQFTLVLRPGATVLKARRSVRDTTGEPRKLLSLAVPANGNTPVVALVVRDAHNREAPATADDLQWCRGARPTPEQPEIDKLIAKLLALPDSLWPAELQRLAPLLKVHEAEPATHALEVELKSAELRRDLVQLARLAELTVAVGRAVDELELQAAGQAWLAIVELYQGHMADAYRKFVPVVALQQQAVERESRPGWKLARQALLATFAEFAANLAGAALDPAADEWRKLAADLYASPLVLPRDAAKAYQDLGFSAGLRGDAKAAVAWLNKALAALGDLPEPLLRAKILARLGQRAQGDEQNQLLVRAEAELAKARSGLDAVGVQMDLGKAWSSRDQYREALRLLDSAVKGLDALPPSPLRDLQLWSALGASGRGYVQYNLQLLPPAAADLQRAIGLQPATLPATDRAPEHQMLGYVLADMGKRAAARAEFERGITLAEQGSGETHWDLALQLREQVAWTWLDSEPPEPAKALQVLDAAIQLAVDKHLVQREGRLCETAAHAASPEANAGPEQRQRTLAYLQRAEQCYDKAKQSEGLARVRKHLAQERRLLAYAQQQKGNRTDAEAALRAALAEFERSGERPEAQEAADQLALLLYEQRRWLESAALWQRYADWLATPEAAVAAQETMANLARPSAETKRNLTPGARRAVTLSLLASCYTAAGEADRALAVREQEAELRTKLGDLRGAAGAWQQLALDAAVAGRRPLFDRAVVFLESQGHDPSDRALLAALRAMPEVLGADLDAARRAKDKLASVLAELSAGAEALAVEQRQGFVQAWAMLGSLQARLGEPSKGLESLEKAARWSDAAGKLAMLSKIGHLCKTLGRLQQALDAQQKVLELAHETAMYVKPAYLLTTLVDVFEVYQALGNQAGAQRVLKEALQVAQDIEAQPQQQADDRKILADFEALLALQSAMSGHNEQAVVLAERALAVYPAQFHDENTATAKMALALARNMLFLRKITAQMQQAALTPKAAEYDRLTAELERGRHEHYLELLAALQGALDELAITPLALGASALQGLAGKLKTQHAPIRSALAAAHTRALAAGRLSDLSTLSWLEGRSAEAVDDLDAAIVAYRRGIEEEEVVRASLGSDLHKAALGDTRDPLYASLELLYVRQMRFPEALEVSEQRRARALLDVLASGQLRGQLRNNAPSRELQQLAEKMQALAAQDQSLDLQLGSGQVARVDGTTGKRQAVSAPQGPVRVRAAGREREAEAVWQQLAEARRKAAGSSAELTSLVTAPAVKIDELREFARMRRAFLVEWSVHDGVLLAYVVSPTGQVDVSKAEIGAKDLEAKVRELRQALGAAVDRDPARGAETLGAPEPSAGDPTALLAGMHAVLVKPIEDLLPHDGMTPVIAAPHRSLLLVPLAALTDEKGRSWGETTSLTVVPSLGILRYTGAKHAAAAAGGALVVGNPQMPAWQGRTLPALLGAEREAASVAKALRGPGIDLLIGPAASETRVRKAMLGKRILHFATHGVARDDAPGESFVALAAGAGNDGFLTVGEVLDLQLRADLVVLSACQTGLGKVSGDGVLGLGRAFLYAGTPRVVVSLWSVPDDPTALHMDTFYRGLRDGLAPADALRAAQAATRAKYPSPSAWAAFEMVGEPR